MSRLGFALLLVSSAALLAGRPGADEWKYDVVHRKAGVPLRGLIVEETPGYIRLRCITRRPGSPTLLFTERIDRDDIRRIDALSKEDRAALETRLETLKRDREALAAFLRATDPGRKGAPPAGDAFDLKPVPWPGDPKGTAVEYRSAYFTLVTDARPELVHLVAIRLEQVYAAYAQWLPPRVEKGTPTTILLAKNLGGYQALAKARGLNLLNPAFFDRDANQVVCGSNLEALGDELERIRAHHDALRKASKERRAELARIYRNRIPPEIAATLDEQDRRVVRTEKKNLDAFVAVRENLFRRLHHEALHAYVNVFVYPAKDGGIPVWLDEGIAQVFETAVAEVGELRVGTPDAGRLASVQAAVKKGTLLPLRDLLRSTDKQFRIAHADERAASDAHYLASWGLAMHLMFQERKTGAKELTAYLDALKRGTDPVAAFEAYTGRGVVAYEKEWHAYLLKVRGDGTAAR